MKDLEQQLKNLIITNVPQSIDLMLPINENAELKTILLQIYSMVKEINEKIANGYIMYAGWYKE